MPPRKRYRSVVIQAATAIAVLVLVISPLVPIVYQSVLDRPMYADGHVLTGANYSALFSNAEFRGALVNSLILAFGATAIAQVIGVIMAILIGRTDLPGRRIFGSVLLWPLFLSHLVLAFGWLILYGPGGYVSLWVKQLVGTDLWNLYSLGGIALIAGVSQAPLTMMYCLAATALADPNMEDAARSCGARQLRTLCRITVPMLLPSLLYSAVLNFTVSLDMLSLPLILGSPVGIRSVTTLIYTLSVGSLTPNYGIAASAGCLLLGIATLCILLKDRMLRNSRRFVSVGGKAARPRLFRLGRYGYPIAILVGLYIAVLIVLPVCALFLRAFVSFLTPFVPVESVLTLDNFVNLLSFEPHRRAIVNSVLVSGVGGAVATAFILLVALVTQRSNFPLRRAVEHLAMIPRAVPGMIVGLGFLYALLMFPGIGWIKNTILILMIVYTARFLPAGLGAIAPNLIQIGPDIDRAARTMGADWWTVSHSILARMLKPAALSCFALLFIHFFKEYAAAVFVVAPGSEMIGVTLLDFWSQGDMGRVAALSTIQIAIISVFIIVAKRALRVNIYG